MTFENVVALVGAITSTGVLAGGVGILGWALKVERRLMKMEVITGV